MKSFLRSLAPHGTVSRDLLRPKILSVLLSENLLQIQRKVYRFKRGTPIPKLNIFISADDVQSFILLQCTLRLLERYQCCVQLHLLPVGINGWSINLQEKYDWINCDAGLFAACYSLEEPHFSSDIEENKRIKTTEYEQVTSLLHHLLQTEKSNQDIGTVRRALDYLRLLWGKEPNLQIPSSPLVSESQLKGNQTLMRKLGYYNPGAIEMEGEWYPPSRLHHLERRLMTEGAFHFCSSFFVSFQLIEGREISNQELLFGEELERTPSMSSPLEQGSVGTKTVEVFYSFRSPYSQLVVPRLRKISSKYSCSISIRPLLPMVTRGLPVPPEKEHYIVLDAAREARLWGIPFGKMIDPLHPARIPFLRALDAFEVASENGLGVNFVESYGVNQWGNGISAGTDSGLQLMMKQANMKQDHIEKVFEIVQNHSPEERFAYWEKKTAENRSYLLSRGLWGVPCLKYNEVILFGQDKLWAIEKMLSTQDAKERGKKISEEDERLCRSISKYAGEGRICFNNK